MTRKFADEIVIKQSLKGAQTFTIDGDEFPWHISDAGFGINVSDGEAPNLTITILARRVTVEHTLD